MPPSNAKDFLYSQGIDTVCEAVGYEAAFDALRKFFEESADSTLRQVFDIEGAFCRDVAAIVAEYPGWDIAFRKNDTEIVATMNRRNVESDDEANEIMAKIRAAFDARNKLPGMKGVRDAITLNYERRPSSNRPADE